MDKGTIRLHNLANFVQPREEDAINLGSGDNGVFHEESGASDQFMNFLLRHSNILRCVSGDEDLLGVPSLGTCRAISVDLREWRREVNGGVRRRLDELYVLS